MGKDGQIDILGHISDSRSLEFLGDPIPLPIINVFGYDLAVTKHMVMVTVAAFLLVLILIPLANQKGAVPRRGRSALESLLVFLRDDIAVPQMGDKAVYFLPFLATMFFFILTCNLLGMVPFGATATGNLNVTAALAVVSFFAVHLSGLCIQGPAHYLHSLVPPVPGWLYPLMFVVELFGHLAKPFALAIRLFANMMAGHIVLLVMLGFIFIFKNLLIASVSVAATVALSCLELFVCFLQAYVFTFLTAVFLGMAVKAEH